MDKSMLYFTVPSQEEQLHPIKKSSYYTDFSVVKILILQDFVTVHFTLQVIPYGDNNQVSLSFGFGGYFTFTFPVNT